MRHITLLLTAVVPLLVFATPASGAQAEQVLNIGHRGASGYCRSIRYLLMTWLWISGGLYRAGARQGEDYPENVRWSYDGVTFATLHVVGSNNGLNDDNDPDEYAARNEANLAWLEETFETARENGCAGVMLVIQANVFEDDNEDSSGFANFKEALEREVTSYDRPVVLVHGDTHKFRIDKPMKSSVTDRRVENFTRVETFGDPDVHWVRATVDPSDPKVFSKQPEIVEENGMPAL